MVVKTTRAANKAMSVMRFTSCCSFQLFKRLELCARLTVYMVN